MEAKPGNIVLFHPFVPRNAGKYVCSTLQTRWIGQGPKVELFEESFKDRFGPACHAVAVGSGTDALHLAYILAGIQEGDEVISPLFTCSATNTPFLYMGARIRFADVQKDTLNIDPEHVRELINEKTKAIVCVHYGGLPCDMDELQSIVGEWVVSADIEEGHYDKPEDSGATVVDWTKAASNIGRMFASKGQI